MTMLRSATHGILMLAMMASLTQAAVAEPAKSGTQCQMLATAGSGPTKAIAEIMATGGFKNIADSRGMLPLSPEKVTCKDGTFMVECTAQGKVCK